jgi:hypothetical protein
MVIDVVDKRPDTTLGDQELFDLVQRRTFLWFWERADQVSGMTPDRTTSPAGLVTIGGTGFGILAILVGAERGFIDREQARDRIARIVSSLERVERYHGVFPHWLDSRTGITIPFQPLDDGGDLVETAFLMQGLLCAREYFGRDLAERIDRLWHAVEWSWHKAPNDNVLLWHWSPRYGFAINNAIRGWNECLIAYVLAAGSPTHPIGPELYHSGWTLGAEFFNGQLDYGVRVPLGPRLGGPLCFAHYSFVGLDPRDLRDRYADYFEQNISHVQLNYRYCVANRGGCAGYGPACWGLTASDNDQGYANHSPTCDLCVIAPTAALSSFPYAPAEAARAMRYFYTELGHRIWTDWGFTDAFSISRNWFSNDHLAIDQGPIVCMMENHRSGLLWRVFMQVPEVRAGLRRLGFSSPALA